MEIMIVFKKKKVLAALRNPHTVKVGLPMEAVIVEGIHNIYCPHCGESVFDSIPNDRWELGVCSHCGGKYFLYK